MAREFKVAYKADGVDSLEALERTCERDEAALGSLIVRMEPVAIDGPDGESATLVTYRGPVELPTETQIGELGLVIPAGGQTEKQVIANNGHLEFLFAGRAFIRGDATAVLVFRKK